MIQTTVLIENDLGLHARAAARLVRLTSQFASDIKLSKQGNQQAIDGKSILGILLLAASKGTVLELIVDGIDEREAVASIKSLVQRRFGEQQ
jgi:phosphocarrier protein